jgi:integrase
MHINRLTARKVATLTKPGRYADGGGLWLQVRSEDRKTWLFRYMRDGKARMMGLGSVNTIDLKKARERARSARAILLDGRDPIDIKHGERAATRIAQAKLVTFKQCAEEFLRVSPLAQAWSNDIHRRQWSQSLKDYAFPVLGSIPVDRIDVALVLKALLADNFWTEKRETASRVRGRIERVLHWAKARNLRGGDNPATWHNLRDILGGKRQKGHYAALPYALLPAFMDKLRARDGIAARAIEFTILTAARSSEALNATWSEISLQEKVWTIPPERMKSRKVHRVPLSEQAIALLEALPRAGGFLFPGEKHGSALSRYPMPALLKEIESNITIHGFRSTFSDWARERTAYPRDVVEIALAHAIKDKTEAAYRRGDALEKRRRLMAEWSRYCEMPAVTADVRALHG